MMLCAWEVRTGIDILRCGNDRSGTTNSKIRGYYACMTRQVRCVGRQAMKHVVGTKPREPIMITMLDQILNITGHRRDKRVDESRRDESSFLSILPSFI